MADSPHMQGSVLGSGLAGMLCAAAALELGHPFPWQVKGLAFVHCFALPAALAPAPAKRLGFALLMDSCGYRHPSRTDPTESASSSPAGACPPLLALPPPSPPRTHAQVGFAASFASKLADTTSSEIGKAYGQTTYLITTLQVPDADTGGCMGAVGGKAQWLCVLLLAPPHSTCFAAPTRHHAAACAPRH